MISCATENDVSAREERDAVCEIALLLNKSDAGKSSELVICADDKVAAGVGDKEEAEEDDARVAERVVACGMDVVVDVVVAVVDVVVVTAVDVVVIGIVDVVKSREDEVVTPVAL